MIRSKQYAEALMSQVLDDAQDSTTVAEKFFHFATTHTITHFVSSVVYHLEVLARIEAVGRAITIQSAHRLSDALVRDITRYVGASKETPVVCDEGVDIIGGFVARFHGIEYDASITSRLEKMRKELTSANNFRTRKDT
jgi:F0F1-type ATP synthase delta subunit